MKKNKLSLTLLTLVLAIPSYALELLADTDLQDVDGQAGADLSFYLSLNQTPVTGGVASTTLLPSYDPAVTPQFDKSIFTDGSDLKLEYARLGVVFNNRTVDDDGNPTGTNTGKKQWITFKSVQGTIHIPRLGIDGATVNYISKANGSYTAQSTDKPALLLSFDEAHPIEIRNLGFQSLAIETDTVANEGVGNISGYLNTDRYTATDGAFDFNNPVTGVAREKGFLGVNMNANLQISGSIRMFSCAGDGAVAHPRC